MLQSSSTSERIKSLEQRLSLLEGDGKGGVAGRKADGAPIAKTSPGFSVAFGAVPGENRGPNPMTPPKMVFDPYYWLR
jgi:hypothetical protein